MPSASTILALGLPAPSTAPPTYATWNPADQSSIILASGNLDATANTSGSSSAGVRGTASHSTGKYYFEILPETFNTGYLGFGLALSTASLTALSPSGTAYMDFDGDFWLNGSIVGGVIGGGAFLWIGIAVDLNAHLLWFRTGTQWNASSTANPATGTGGLDISVISTGPLFPFFTGQTADEVLANFGASAFNGAVPTGFTAGWTTGGAIQTLAGVIAPSTSLSGNLSAIFGIGGTIVPTTHLSGADTAILGLGGTIAPTTHLSGAETAIFTLGGTIASTPTLAGNLFPGVQSFGGTIAATATLGGSLINATNLAGVIAPTISLRGVLPAPPLVTHAPALVIGV